MNIELVAALVGFFMALFTLIYAIYALAYHNQYKHSDAEKITMQRWSLGLLIVSIVLTIVSILLIIPQTRRRARGLRYDGPVYSGEFSNN
jgi:hypothetical protein